MEKKNELRILENQFKKINVNLKKNFSKQDYIWINIL